MKGRTKIVVSRDRMWGDTFAVRMGRKISDESIRYSIALPVQFKTQSEDDHGIEVDPCFTLNKDDAQAFMDELWSSGFRPTEGSGSAGSLAATQSHLRDMRAIVSKQLGVELK